MLSILVDKCLLIGPLNKGCDAPLISAADQKSTLCPSLVYVVFSCLHFFGSVYLKLGAYFFSNFDSPFGVEQAQTFDEDQILESFQGFWFVCRLQEVLVRKLYFHRLLDDCTHRLLVLS